MSQILTLSVILGFIFLFSAVESGSTKYMAVDLSYRDIYQILAPLCTGGLLLSLPTLFGLSFLVMLLWVKSSFTSLYRRDA